jgi:phosphopentomutase
MKRAIVLLLDSFGVGATPDAAPSDQGADTFGHIALRCYDNQTPLHIPNLISLGLGEVSRLVKGEALPGIKTFSSYKSLYGAAREKSRGKDTPSGHWEIAGVPVLFDWGYFNTQTPCFPQALLEALIEQTGVKATLGNKHASGTEIINEYGDEHCRTGFPIVYTSADSVFQIAAHEEHFGLERLYQVCDIARKLVDSYNIGRVIARPFLGEKGNYYRTGNRRDLAVMPPSKTLLQHVIEAGGKTIAIGKTADIFAHQGISEDIRADGNDALFEATLKAFGTADEGSLIFSNFVDFDSKYGHRRDVKGYAKALEKFDAQLPRLMTQLKEGDVVIITADHGCDPTFPGSDHTREHIPILAFGPGIQGDSVGIRESFSDIGQSIAKHLGINPLAYGHSFL